MTEDDPTAVFSLLGDETRIGIMQALAENQREDVENRGLSFADLRSRVGMRDSGNFNYHLDKLTGVFVEKSEDVYQLTYSGMRVVGAIMGGYGVEGAGETEATPLDETCSTCGEGLELKVQGSQVGVDCGNDHGIANVVPPRILEGRSPREVAHVVALHSYHDAFLATDGVCPQCFGRMEWRGQQLDEASVAPLAFAGICQACGMPLSVLPGHVAMWHPATMTALWETGVSVWEQPLEIAFRGGQAEVVDVAEEGDAATARAEVGDRTITVRTEISDGGLSAERVD
jgi:DNA-binding transcriptional ArsR family regulator